MKKIFISIISIFTMVFAGCHFAEESTKNNNSISVVTSFYPLAFFTKEIAGDYAQVSNISGNKSPHSYKLSPKDRASLSKADLVIYQGIGLESWTEDTIPELEKNGIKVLEASHDLKLNKRHEETEEDNHEVDEHDDHKHGEFDPHTWLDPILAKQISEEITEKLIEIDPKNKNEYKDNLSKLVIKLDNLDKEYNNYITNCINESAIVSHDAFGYLEKRYNFELHPISGISPNDEPSVKIIAELKNIVKQEKITHILTEKNNIEKYSKTISKETGLEILSIDPMGITPKNSDYFKTSKENILSISKALKCQ
jgi:zinc transport system substrate-binding protein